MVTYDLDPSLLRILDILLQTYHTFARFQITAGQSSSATNITLPRYLKDRTISSGHPWALNTL